MQRRDQFVPGKGVPAQPSDAQAGSGHISSMKQPGLAWVARQMRRQAASAAAPEPGPSQVLPVPPRAHPHHSDATQGEMVEGSDAARYGYYSTTPGFQNAPREATGEHPPVSRAAWHGSHLRCSDHQPGGAQADRVGIQSSGQSAAGYGDRGHGHLRPELASGVEMFGFMDPCWRIIESAHAYMDQGQLQYMKSLILAHVRKPMSREQLLERAEGCLEEQDQIFNAFERTFDYISRPPQAPLHPMERQLHPGAQSASYSRQRPPDTYATHAGLHSFPPSQLPPPRALNEYGEDPHQLRPVDDSGQRGVPIILPCGCTGRWPPGGPANKPS